ncbi:MAG: AAA family ATPase [Desulfobulbaceae bacterium]|jgi:CO dehydrogenase maturation factor|nr:AAA family ATPase [Desulfobulbaceae bacterium]
MGLKIAIGGKGGVGKTTMTALLARCLAAQGGTVIAIDADPVTNLAAGLGIPEDQPITPIAELRDLIAERTGATPGTMGGFFTLNPKVDDIPERFSRERDGVKLLVMGTVKSGGSGCICPESTILKALMSHLVLHRDEIVLMDMEAGVEHLGRGTSASVDALIIVVNPGARSRAAAATIRKLGQDIGIKKIVILGNRVRGEEDIRLIQEALADFPMLGFIPEQEEVAKADRQGRRPFENIADAPLELLAVVSKLREMETKVAPRRHLQ